MTRVLPVSMAASVIHVQLDSNLEKQNASSVQAMSIFKVTNRAKVMTVIVVLFTVYILVRVVFGDPYHLAKDDCVAIKAPNDSFTTETLTSNPPHTVELSKFGFKELQLAKAAVRR